MLVGYPFVVTANWLTKGGLVVDSVSLNVNVRVCPLELFVKPVEVGDDWSAVEMFVIDRFVTEAKSLPAKS
jgi:hypothetical protein